MDASKLDAMDANQPFPPVCRLPGPDRAAGKEEMDARQPSFNRGHALAAEWDGRSEPFADGFGICSPTRWRPSARGWSLPSDACKLAKDLQGTLLAALRSEMGDLRREAFRLATGNMKVSPFKPVFLTRLRNAWVKLLGGDPQLLEVPDRQPFLFLCLGGDREEIG